MKFLEDERARVHEAGHCLAAIVLMGAIPRVDVETSGAGRCRVRWEAGDVKLSDDDAAFVLADLVSSRAGLAAERLLYGHADIPGAADDFKDWERSLAAAQTYPELKDLTRAKIDGVVDYLLKRFQPQLDALAATIGVGHTTAEQLVHALQQVDTRRTLGWYLQNPILADGHWQRRWQELRQEVGRHYAFEWIDGPVPEQRDYLAFSAKHAAWNRRLGLPAPRVGSAPVVKGLTFRGGPQYCERCGEVHELL